MFNLVVVNKILYFESDTRFIVEYIFKEINFRGSNNSVIEKLIRYSKMSYRI